VLDRQGAKIAALRREQFGCWKTAGEQFEALLDTFGELVDVAERHDRLVHEVRVGNLLTGYASREEWSGGRGCRSRLSPALRGVPSGARERRRGTSRPSPSAPVANLVPGRPPKHSSSSSPQRSPGPQTRR
jgi:hypothetical protein